MVTSRELSFSTPRTITCYEWGAPDAARTALCVHGLTRNGRDFDFLAHSLAEQGYRVLCPDMPGRGKSPWLPSADGYNNMTYAADVLHILDALNIEKVDWVGTSMGGIIAMMLAASAPQRINKLVLNDVGAVISGAGLARIFGYASNRLSFATRAEGEAVMRIIFAPFGITDETHWQHMFEHSLVAHSDGAFTLAYDPAIIASLPRPEGEVKDVDLWPFMAGIFAIPTLLIRGAQSDLLTHETALAMKAAHPRLALHEVPNAGHAPSLMDACDIRVIGEFLTEA